MQLDMTKGPVTRSLLVFAGPLIAGNLLQQFYTLADTFIVGQFLGTEALAAVGASYSVVVLLTSVLLGLCMGSGVLFSMQFGAKDISGMKQSFALSFVFIGVLTILIEAAAILLLPAILRLIRVPASLVPMTKTYLGCILWGLFFTFLYNYFASLLRAVGNSAASLWFLAVAAFLNIGLDLFFIFPLQMGVFGAALATVLAEAFSAIGIGLYCAFKMPSFFPKKEDFRFQKDLFMRLSTYSLLTCIQQSIMNFGILMVQGLVNSFGVAAMAAFAAGVKIDTLAYMPVQDFGNAFSTYIAQNQGAGKPERSQKGLAAAIRITVLFCLCASLVVVLFAPQLMRVFVSGTDEAVLAIGVQYLRIEGAFYCGIGCLFLFYGLFRGMGRPGVSVFLTVLSLGARVTLAYLLAPLPSVGLLGIWWAIPIGWLLADAAGLALYRRLKKQNAF